MKIMSRSLLYLKRKKGKTSILFFILFLLSILCFLGIAIKSSSENAIKALEERLGGSFTVTLKNYSQEERPDLYVLEEADDGNEYYVYKDEVKITDEILDKIKSVHGIQRDNGESWTLLYMGNITLFPGMSTSYIQDYKAGEYGDTEYDSRCEVDKQMASFFGNKDSSLNAYFKAGTLKLTQGRHIQENDVHKIMISEELAERNNLQVGDSLDVDFYLNYTSKEDFKITKSLKMEIVGLYQNNGIQSDGEYLMESDVVSNYIFSDEQTIREAFKNGVYSAKNKPKEFEYGTLTFFMEDSKKLDSIISEVKKLSGINQDYFEIKKDDSAYKSSVEPLNFMKQTVIIIILLVAVSSIVLLSLISMMWLLERKKEIEILVSIGNSKAEILLQLILEYFIVTTVAIVVAFLVSAIMVDKVGNSFLHFVNQEESSTETEKSIDASDYIGEDGTTDLEALADAASKIEAPSQTPDTLNIHIGLNEVLVVGIIELLVLFFSIFRVVNKVLKMKPREIMTDLS